MPMIREYRGKRVDNGKWVKGFCLLESNPSSHTNDCLITTYKVWKFAEVKLTGAYSVIPETLGQFIGLTDKNGNKIYEGDIAKYILSNEHYVVVYDIFHAKFILRNILDSEDETDFYDVDNRDLEIIGNIHDNKDLLVG